MVLNSMHNLLHLLWCALLQQMAYGLINTTRKSLTILSIFIFTIFFFFHKFIFILIIFYTLSFIVFTLTFLL